MRNIIKYIRLKVLALRDLKWAVFLFHYPRSHPAMLAVDSVARYTAYQASRNRVQITDELRFPRGLWKALLDDADIWKQMRRSDPNEPPL